MKKLSLAILVAFLTQVAFAENLKWEDADCRFEKITSKSQTDIELDSKNDVDRCGVPSIVIIEAQNTSRF